MNTPWKHVVAAGLATLTLAGALIVDSTAAFARWHHYGYYHPYYGYHHYYYHRHYGYGPAPIFGALIGGIAAGALAAPYYHHYYYYGPGPYYYGPGPYYYGW